MSKRAEITNVSRFENYQAARKYLKETFYKAEDSSDLMVACALWASLSMKQLRLKIETGEDFNTSPFPDLKMRNFEELGRELDGLFRDLNEKFPKFKFDKE